MGVVHENFWAWRFKILAIAVVLSFMLISIVKRCILPLFFGVVFIVTLALPASAVTWNDVIIAWAAHLSPQGCASFVTKYTQSGQTGYQLWDRCNASSVLSYKKVVHNGGQLFANYWSAPYNCVGNWSGNSVNFYTTYDGGVDYETPYYCSGGAGAPVNMGGPSRPTLQQECYLGLKNTSGQYTNASDPTLGTNCAALDTQFGNFYPVTNDCQYTGLEVFGPGGSSGMVYKSFVPDDGKTSPCNQCVPAGTASYGNPNHNTPVPGNPSQFQCYWKDVTGDPGKPADAYTPPANGGGGAGDEGGLRDGTTSTTETVSDGNGNTETSTTTTTTTNNQDGTTSTTTTEKITYCHDANADGISDITGRKCAESTTSTSTSNPPSATPSTPSPYSNGNLPTVGNFGDLFTQFANQMRNTPLFSTFSLSGLSPSGSGVSTYSINAGTYGNHQIDLADYSTSLNIIKGIVLLLGSYLAVRIVVLKR